MPLIVDKEAVRKEILMAFERCIEKKPMTKTAAAEVSPWRRCYSVFIIKITLRGLLIQSHDAPKMHPDGWVWVHRLIVCIVAV